MGGIQLVNIKDIHQQIYNNFEWRMWNEIIENYSAEHGDKFTSRHGMSHALDVAIIASNFVHDAGGTEHEADLADIAAMLHDCGLICGDEHHAHCSAQMARAFLHAHWGKYGGTIRRYAEHPTRAHRINGPLSDEDIEIIAHAIENHSSGADIQNLVDAALCLADKIDIGKHRVVGDGNDVQLMESQIRRVSYTLADNETLYVDYEADPAFDAKEFIRRWPKGYYTPVRVAEFLNRHFVLRLNGKEVA